MDESVVDNVTSEGIICFLLIGTEIVKHKLDMETGEWIAVRPYNRKKYKVKARQDDGSEAVYVWNVAPLEIETYSSADEDIKEFNSVAETRGRKPKVYDNSYVKRMLSPCQTYDSAKLTFPFFDSIMFGVSHLHDGDKPFSANLLFKLLVTLDSISTDSVQILSNKSERYARKLSTAVQVASRELSKKIDGYVFEYIDSELPTVDKEQLLIDRQAYIDWFKKQQANGLYNGYPVPK